jgi:hypothetical protein
LLSYPTLSGVQKLQHETNAKGFIQKYKDAVPGIGQLALFSSASTRPPSHRIGQRGGYKIFEELGVTQGFGTLLPSQTRDTLPFKRSR